MTRGKKTKRNKTKKKQTKQTKNTENKKDEQQQNVGHHHVNNNTIRHPIYVELQCVLGLIPTENPKEPFSWVRRLSDYNTYNSRYCVWRVPCSLLTKAIICSRNKRLNLSSLSNSHTFSVTVNIRLLIIPLLMSA